MASKTSKTSRTKTQVKQQLESIQSEERESLDRVSASAKKAEADRVRGAVSHLSVDGLLKDIANINPAIQKALLDVTTSLTQKVQELSDVTTAIELAKADLKEVHDLEVVATSLENLLAEHMEKQAEIDAEVRALEENARKLELQLDSEYRTKREELENQRKKEVVEYQYQLTQTRLRDKTEFDRAQEDLARQNKLRQELLEKDWKEREEVLAKDEKELIGLREQAATFPETLRKEVAKAEAIAVSSTTRNKEHEFALKQKDFESKIALLEAANKQAEADKTKMAETITQLQTKLESAMKQAGEIASKALESASGNLAMAKMKEVIDSNGASSNSGKRS